MQPKADVLLDRSIANTLPSLYKAIMWRLIPFLCFCYFAAYLDRINIGFAKLQMAKELNFGESAYGFGAGLFFVGYILFEVPSNAILQRVGAKVWIGRIMITWGLVSFLTMFVRTPTQFYMLRFLLGVAEAGFLPGVLFYLTTWFPSNQRGRAISLFMIGLPLSSLIGAPLSGYIIGHFDQWRGLSGWQWLFVLESAPSILLGLLTFFVLPDSFQRAKWIDEDERSILARVLAAETSNIPQKHRWKDGVFDLKIWMLGGIDFSILLSTYALSFWMPTFISRAGTTDPLHIGLLTAVPSLAGVIGMLLIAVSSDKRGERRWHIIVPLTVDAAAMAVSTLFTTHVAATVFLFSIASGAILGAVPVFFTLPATFLPGAAAAAGFAMACSLANIAGLVSNSLMGLVLEFTHSSVAAMLFFATCLVLSSLIAFALPKTSEPR